MKRPGSRMTRSPLSCSSGISAAAKESAALAQVSKAHKRMRERVMNGVCPCCNRTFQNLREHMKSEHADFGTVQTLAALRQAFGMTQEAVAKEAAKIRD